MCNQCCDDTENEDKGYLMPSALTHENGGKGLLIGDFYEVLRQSCTFCAEDGLDAELDCEMCGGTGYIETRIQVSWTTIKAIYKKALEIGIPQ